MRIQSASAHPASPWEHPWACTLGRLRHMQHGPGLVSDHRPPEAWENGRMHVSDSRLQYRRDMSGHPLFFPRLLPCVRLLDVPYTYPSCPPACSTHRTSSKNARGGRMHRAFRHRRMSRQSTEPLQKPFKAPHGARHVCGQSLIKPAI